MRSRPGPAALLDQWRRLSPLPGGKWLFSRLLGRVAPGIRAILIGFEIEYLKKARGPLAAEGSAPEIADPAPRVVLAEAVIRNTAGEVVARAVARWRVGPERERAAA